MNSVSGGMKRFWRDNCGIPKIVALDVTNGAWHAFALKIRSSRLEIEIDGLTVLWLEGAEVARALNLFRVRPISLAGALNLCLAGYRTPRGGRLLSIDDTRSAQGTRRGTRYTGRL